ncbi:hypothetical protein [Desulfuromonas sp. AOP6]|uniref:hypothetical protein n=1 Tax=Desulfuromonas sp. AOP6 TaxID=1566351 RepID=UPI00128601F0|nr:hypothetical protein [Desulfuromonas sp. AOP6]BCA78435.1 hypothetical protein AOP6_0222 [Desulfuromonas sp. AOP6]
MKKFLIIIILLSMNVFVPNHACSEIKDASIKKLVREFQEQGFKTCSEELGNAFDFVVDGGNWNVAQRWSTDNTDQKPYYLYFIVHGNDKSYSKSGTVIMTKTSNGECWGEYTNTTVVPNISCNDYIQKSGFTKNNGWDIKIRGKNGDGGEYMIMDVDSSSLLKFILNDSPVGCVFTKTEIL